MKHYQRTKILFILSIFLIMPYMQAKAQEEVRINELFNFNWKYSTGDFPDAKKINFDDSQWQVINLPHDGSIGGPFDQTTGTRENGFRPRHIGWYRKTFTLPYNLKDKKISIEFEGVYRDAEVWINDSYLGKQQNGYVGFVHDITKYINPQGKNVIAVRYDNTYVSSRWYTGEGIYRNVWLQITNPLQITENGIYITTPSVNKDKAQIAIQTEVSNQTDTCMFTTLRTEIYSPDGKQQKSILSTVPIAPRGTYTFRQYTIIDQPSIWDINSPSLYTVKSYIINNSKTVDNYKSRFGIRTVDFNAEQGFLLNGRKVFLKGVNIHHDLGPLGSAFFEKGMKRRLQGLKEMGCNAIRLSHNPYAKAVLDMCDEMGILVYDECFDKWDTPTWNHYGPKSKFDEHWRKDLEWFIKRDRNHPSVFIWSVGNEVFDKGTFHQMENYFVPMLKNMVDFVHKLEPSRKVTCGLFPFRKETPVPMAFLMDVVSDNYMSQYYKEDHQKYPQLIFLQSETSTRNGGDDFFKYDHSYACGQFYWGGTDYIGESFRWPSKGWDGIIDWCDFWKPLTYFIQSLYSDKDMVKIAVRNGEANDNAIIWNNVALNYLNMSSSWNWKPNQKLNIFTFTTAEEVELFVNNKSLGIKKMKDYPKKKIPWELTFEAGTIKAVARTNGKEVATDEIKTAGKPHSIILSTDSTHVIANGMDLAYITVSVVDKNGILVPDANNSIKFNIAGVGTLAGVGNGDRNSDEHFDANSRKVHGGKCLLIIRSTTTPGKIKIKATSKGLKQAILTINALGKSSGNTKFTPGKLWLDNNKVHINAHGGGVLFHEGKYYWFGEHKTEGRIGNVANVGVHCYSSEDLYNWKDEGIALKVEAEGSGSPIEKGCILERPKVVYNKKNGKFVMWFHLEPKDKGYASAWSGVAVSDKVQGPYKFLKAGRVNPRHWPLNISEKQKKAPIRTDGIKFNGGSLPIHPDTLNILGRDFKDGQMARDMNIFVDDDGKAYHIYSSEENSTLHIALLDEEYTAHTGIYTRNFVGRFMEAPAMFKKDGKYYLMMSGCTGWQPNQARSAVANSILGEWKELGDPCIGDTDKNTFHSQSSFILPVHGQKNKFIYMGDRWTPNDAINGRYIWLPVEFEGERFILNWKDEWKLK